MDMKKNDDDSSSDDSYCFVDHSKADDVGADGSDSIEGNPLADQNKANNPKPEASAKSTSKEPLVQEVAKVSYNGIVIKIFCDSHISPRKDVRNFYFEPVVFLEPDSIEREFNKLLKQDLVRFKIKIWDAEIRSKVMERLRSLPSLKDLEIHEEYVHVMPFEEAQLVANPGSILKSIRLADRPLSYRNESLYFHFKCDISPEADDLAESLKKEPELIVMEWNLAMECRGFHGRPNCSFNVNTLACDQAESYAIVPDSVTTLLPRLTDMEAMIQSASNRSIEACAGIRDLEDQMEILNNRHAATAVPIFSVEQCTNPDAASGESYGFSNVVIDTNTDHGEFDLPSGIFTVKTTGIYQLNFNGHAFLSAGLNNDIGLFVNDEPVAWSCINCSAVSGHLPAVISSLLRLKGGDEVGIFASHGELNQEHCSFDEHYNQTYFSGVLIGLGHSRLSSTRLSV